MGYTCDPIIMTSLFLYVQVLKKHYLLMITTAIKLECSTFSIRAV